MIIIDHEKYGMRTEFETWQEATEAIKACGPEYENTELIIGSQKQITDQDGDVVGYVESKPPTYYSEVLKKYVTIPK